MNKFIGALCLGAGLTLAGTALAEPYVDYTTSKGVWEVQAVKVDPNHLDDYLTALKTGWVLGEEIARKHGVIDQFAVRVKLNSGAGANVLLVQHYPALSGLEPDRTRDVAMMKEARAAVSKVAEAKATAGFDKYRTFVSDEFYTNIEYPK
jgi:hypothetical protein